MKNSMMIQLTSVLAVLGLAPAISADVIPPGLQPGDQYRIIFVTSTTTTSESGDLSYYDSAVDNAVNDPGSLLQSLGATWQAIVSTKTTSAEQHIGADSVPIYLVNGLKIANTTQDLFGGLATLLSGDVDVDQRGNTSSSPFAWTGTGPDGSAADPLGGGATATVGCTIINTQAWIDFTDQDASQLLPLYGISSVLTVPTPEPGNSGLLVFGVLLLLMGAQRICTPSARV